MRPFSVGKNLEAGVKTTMFIVPTKFIALWNLLYAHNGTASAKNFSAWWYDASEDIEIPIVYNYPLPASEYLKFDGGAYITLEAGDEIRVQIETGATNASALVTVELHQKIPTQYF